MKTKKQGNQKLIVICVTVGIFIVIASVLFFMNRSSRIQINEDSYQIVVGSKIDYSKGTSFLKTEDGLLKDGAKKNETMAASPIYTSSLSSLLMPKDMGYSDPREKSFYRVNNGTKVDVTKDVYQRGFLYDGRGTYLFLEEMTLNVNGQDQTMHSYGFITVVSGSYYLYDPVSKTMDMDAVYSGITASTKDYQLDAVNGIIYDANDQKILLFDRFDELEQLAE